MIKESILSAMSSDVITVNEATSLLDIYERGGITMDSKNRLRVYEYIESQLQMAWIKFENYEDDAFETIKKLSPNLLVYTKKCDDAADKALAECEPIRSKLASKKKELISIAKSNKDAFIDDIDLTDEDMDKSMPRYVKFSGDVGNAVKLAMDSADAFGKILLKYSDINDKLTKQLDMYIRACMYDVDDMMYVILEFIRTSGKKIADPNVNNWRKTEPTFKFKFK